MSVKPNKVAEPKDIPPQTPSKGEEMTDAEKEDYEMLYLNDEKDNYDYVEEIEW